jgi:hypothetical protein
MRTMKRKTRSDKFPLTLHTTGQYCKKIKGKMYYFGSDKKEALQLVLRGSLWTATVMFANSCRYSGRPASMV